MDTKPFAPYWILWDKEFEDINKEFLVLQEEIFTVRKQIYGKTAKGVDTKCLEKLPFSLASEPWISGSFSLPPLKSPTVDYLTWTPAEENTRGLEWTSIGLTNATDIPDKLYGFLFDETPIIGYLAALVDTLKPTSSLWPSDERYYTQERLTELAEFKQHLFTVMYEQVTKLKDKLHFLHSVRARVSEKQAGAANPGHVFKAFIKNNKLPAPSDEDSKRNRLPITVAEELADLLDLTDKEMATILTISIRTYHRLKLNGLLNPVASERLILLKDLAAYGLEVFEAQQTFNKWLRLHVRDLSDSSPLNTLDTATGFNQVKAVLERIEYGVYS